MKRFNGGPPLQVKVWGELACFTRPEAKVERVSYPVMTPSAARGILEAIYWRTEIAWQVREILVLRPIRWFSILRNEVNNRQSERGDRINKGYYYVEEDRAQRHTLALRDVAYVINAEIVIRPGANEGAAQHVDQFRRCVERGRCHHQPALGCREFPAWFSPPEKNEHPLGELGDDLGLMLFDLKYRHNEQGLGIGGEPVLFSARLEGGVLRIPPEKYQEVE